MCTNEKRKKEMHQNAFKYCAQRMTTCNVDMISWKYVVKIADKRQEYKIVKNKQKKEQDTERTEKAMWLKVPNAKCVGMVNAGCR